MHDSIAVRAKGLLRLHGLTREIEDAWGTQEKPRPLSNGLMEPHVPVGLLRDTACDFRVNIVNVMIEVPSDRVPQ